MTTLFRNLILFLTLQIIPVVIFAQTSGTKVGGEKDSVVALSDTSMHYFLKPIDIFPDKKDMKPKALREYTLLEYKVKKVYPMAKVAAIKLAEYNRVYSTFKTERERKKYVKGVEKELFSEFEDELRQMKVSEGRILIKLLDRETGNSSFEIIKEFKGGFSAFFWQSVARLFGHDLKAQYDPVMEDRLIEYIILQIDLGLI
ncbi:MAG: DUF4294 domain-containing protein [Prolixibacteraceae bacterium]